MSSRFVPFVCAGITIALLLVFLNRDYPAVGLDFVYFVPRLIDTDLHIRVNGLGPQWYTPSFGGGLPAFANPQHLQYSLIQLLFLVTGPWTAVLVSSAVVSALGFAACYLYLNRILSLSVVASTLGAMSVVGNGFYYQHLAGGHVGFQLFPLIAVFLLAGTSPTLTIPAASVLCGTAAAAIVYNGGALLAVLIGPSLIITLQVAHLLAPASVNWARLSRIAVIAGVIALALCGPKLYAVNAFMTHFPRLVSDSHDTGTASALFGLGSQLAGGMMIIPILYAGGFPTQRLEDALVRVTGANVHSPELDVSIQPVLTIALAVAACRILWRAWRGRGATNLAAPHWVPLVLLCVTVWIAVETTLARGFVYPALHALPFFQSMHINQRVAVVFVMPITVAGAMAIDAWRAHRRPAIAAVLLAAAVMFQASYELLPELFYRRWFDMTRLEQVHARVRAGERFPIDIVSGNPEENVFEDHASSRALYEPVFGYDNEYYKPDTIIGPIDAIRDGRFNLTNPASLIFPELNGLRPFERIHIEDRRNLTRFVNRQQPEWRYPRILDWLNGVAALTLFGCVVTAVGSTWTRLRRR